MGFQSVKTPGPSRSRKGAVFRGDRMAAIKVPRASCREEWVNVFSVDSVDPEGRARTKRLNLQGRRFGRDVRRNSLSCQSVK